MYYYWLLLHFSFIASVVQSSSNTILVSGLGGVDSKAFSPDVFQGTFIWDDSKNGYHTLVRNGDCFFWDLTLKPKPSTNSLNVEIMSYHISSMRLMLVDYHFHDYFQECSEQNDFAEPAWNESFSLVHILKSEEETPLLTIPLVATMYELDLGYFKKMLFEGSLTPDFSNAPLSATVYHLNPFKIKAKLPVNYFHSAAAYHYSLSDVVRTKHKEGDINNQEMVCLEFPWKTMLEVDRHFLNSTFKYFREFIKADQQLDEDDTSNLLSSPQYYHCTDTFRIKKFGKDTFLSVLECAFYGKFQSYIPKNWLEVLSASCQFGSELVKVVSMLQYLRERIQENSPFDGSIQVDHMTPLDDFIVKMQKSLPCDYFESTTKKIRKLVSKLHLI